MSRTERVYIEEYGDELVCPICFSLVPNDYTEQHERWHAELARGPTVKAVDENG